MKAAFLHRFLEMHHVLDYSELMIFLPHRDNDPAQKVLTSAWNHSQMQRSNWDPVSNILADTNLCDPVCKEDPLADSVILEFRAHSEKD